MHVANIIKLVISLGLEIWLLTLLFRRDVRHHFPVFFSYGAISIPITLARLLTLANYQVYFLVFWWSNALLLILGLAALHESFRWVYEGFYQFWWFRLVYFGTIAVVLLITARNAMVNPPVQAHPLVGLILNMGIAVNLLQAGIAALFGILAKPLAIEHRRYPFGIVAGFAISSLGPFVGYLVRSIFGKNLDTFTQNASAVAYILGLVIWVAAFARPEPEEKAWTPPMPPEEMLGLVRGYLRALGVKKER
jgi:putative Mn2+ efflux pump MntP